MTPPISTSFIFTTPISTKIDGKPTRATLQTLQKQLNANASHGRPFSHNVEAANMATSNSSYPMPLT
jgi:hypothetical protein